IAYVERNPIRAGLADRADRYPWSSTRARLSPSPPDYMDLGAWRTEYTNDQWLEALSSSVDEELFGRRLHEASRRGRPLGDAEFIAELERRCDRTLMPKAVGHPRKDASKPHPEPSRLALKIGI